jgi:hypothetical protein
LGEESANFETLQNESSPIISGIENSKNSCPSDINGLKVGELSAWVRSGDASHGNEWLLQKWNQSTKLYGFGNELNRFEL